MYLIIVYSLLPAVTLLFALVGCSEKKNDAPSTVPSPSVNLPMPSSATNKSTTTNISPQFPPPQDTPKMAQKVDSDDKIAVKKTASKEDLQKSDDDEVKVVSMKGGNKQGSVMVTARRAASRVPSCKPSKMKKSGEEGDSGYEMCPTLTPEQLKNALQE